MLSFPKLFKATVQLLQSFDQSPAYIFFSNTMLIFMYIMCSIDFQDKSLNRLSPLDSIISPWPTTGRLSTLQEIPVISLSLYLSFYLFHYLSIRLLSRHSIYLSHIYFSIKLFHLSLYIIRKLLALVKFSKNKIKINPLF